MKKGLLDNVTEDLLLVPPFITRNIHRKLFKSAFANLMRDISLLHFSILRTLSETGPLHVAEIGGRLQIPRPQMTHLIDKLVSLNLVARETDKEDRRTINIMLTSEGSAFLGEQKKFIKKATKKALSSLTNEELEELSISLRKLRDILSKL